MAIRLKKCTSKEVLELQKLSIETFTDTFGPFNKPENMKAYMDSAYNLEKLKSEIENPNSRFYFLYKDNELAAYTKLNLEEAQGKDLFENSLEVERIYVKSNFKRQGLGKVLIEKALEVSKENKVDRLWLGVWELNSSALSFYEEMGFRKYKTYQFVMGDGSQTNYIMVNNLS